MSGASVRTGIDAKELQAFRKALKDRSDAKAWQRSLASANRRAGEIIAADARRRAVALGPRGAKAAAGIQASSNQIGIRIRVANTSRSPATLATIWGAKKRTGWYSRGRYRDSDGEQHPEWVGSDWEVGEPGQGPYAVNPAIAAKRDEAIEMWAESIDRLMREL
jgi:hypothetical protein